MQAHELKSAIAEAQAKIDTLRQEDSAMEYGLPPGVFAVTARGVEPVLAEARRR
ncbi:MAG: hypothetical protein ABWZ78_01500 [Burkholderiaceae bacterium]